MQLQITGYKKKSEYTSENGIKSVVYLMDCNDFMAQVGENQFSLAVCDPQYGIDIANMNMGTGNGKRQSKIQNRKWKPKDWDKEPPDSKYFDGVFKVAKNQIIWGANYFGLPPTKYFCVWDKGEGLYGRSFAECEYAWVKEGGTRIFKCSPFQKDRSHPTQKPVKLYDWILKHYAKQGDTIFDSHLGSGSSRISAHKAGLHFFACEIDEEYFEAQERRFKDFTSQLRMF